MENLTNQSTRRSRLTRRSFFGRITAVFIPVLAPVLGRFGARLVERDGWVLREEDI